jgi:hypothetical protein
MRLFSVGRVIALAVLLAYAHGLFGTEEAVGLSRAARYWQHDSGWPRSSELPVVTSSRYLFASHPRSPSR